MSTKHDECCSLEKVFEAMIVKLEKSGASSGQGWMERDNFPSSLITKQPKICSHFFALVFFFCPITLSFVKCSLLKHSSPTKVKFCQLWNLQFAQSYIYSVYFFLCFFLSVQSMNLYIYIKRNGGSRILEQEEIFGFSLKYLVLLLLF